MRANPCELQNSPYVWLLGGAAHDTLAYLSLMPRGSLHDVSLHRIGCKILKILLVVLCPGDMLWPPGVRPSGGLVAACRDCGAKARLGYVHCDSCKAKLDAARQRRHEESARKQLERQQDMLVRQQEIENQEAKERDLQAADFVNQSMTHIRNALSAGLQPSLLRVEVLSTTCSLNGSMSGSPPDVRQIAAYAAHGWEVLTTIPQTEGVGLTNRTGNGNTVWGAGVGGLVTGVYLIMKLPITAAYLQKNEDYVRSAVRSYYVEGVSSQVSGASFAPPSFDQGQNVMSNLANAGLGVAAGLLVTDAVAGLVDSIGDGGFDAGGGDFGAFEF